MTMGFLNTIIGKASRHAISWLAGALGAAGLSSGSSVEVATAIVGLALNVLVSSKLK